MIFFCLLVSLTPHKKSSPIPDGLTWELFHISGTMYAIPHPTRLRRHRLGVFYTCSCELVVLVRFRVMKRDLYHWKAEKTLIPNIYSVFAFEAQYSRKTRSKFGKNDKLLKYTRKLQQKIFKKIFACQKGNNQSFFQFLTLFFSNTRHRGLKLNIYLELAFSQLSNDIGHVP